MRRAFELFPQAFSQVGHGVKVLGALLMDPAKQLGSAKALLSELLTKNGQTVEIKVKQVGRHGVQARADF